MVLQQNADAYLPRWNADDEGKNDRRLIISTLNLTAQTMLLDRAPANTDMAFTNQEDSHR